MFKKSKNIQMLKPFITPYKWQFIGAVLMIVLMVAAMTTAPRVEGLITTSLAKDAVAILQKIPGARVDFGTVSRILILLFVIYLMKTGAQMMGIAWLTNSIQHAMHDLRNAVQNKIRRLPVRYFDTHSFGDVLSRVTNDIDTISGALQQSFSQVISGILTLCFAIGMMVSIQPVMALIVLIIIPFSLIISRFVVRISQKQFQEQQNAVGELNGMVTEMYTGFKEILLFNKQQSSVKEFGEINERLRKHAFRAQFLSSLMSPLISLVTYLMIGIIGVIGAILAIGGGMTIGNLQ
ncbi:MAG: ABC transporter ATP-binding protein, partial [Lachnospiraceae bacterium]